MNAIELRECSKSLRGFGIIDRDDEIMQIVDLLPSPIFYIVNPIKLESFLRGKGYKDDETLKDFIVSNYGVEAFNLLSSLD